MAKYPVLFIMSCVLLSLAGSCEKRVHDKPVRFDPGLDGLAVRSLPLIDPSMSRQPMPVPSYGNIGGSQESPAAGVGDQSAETTIESSGEAVPPSAAESSDDR